MIRPARQRRMLAVNGEGATDLLSGLQNNRSLALFFAWSDAYWIGAALACRGIARQLILHFEPRQLLLGEDVHRWCDARWIGERGGIDMDLVWLLIGFISHR